MSEVNLNNWHYSKEGKTIGPVALECIHDLVTHGAISSQALVWQPVMPEWQPYAILFHQYLQNQTGTMPPPLPPHNHTNATQCPSCQSVQTMSVEMVIKSGTQDNTSIGLGLSSGGRVGIGIMGGQSQTALAQKYALGSRPDGSGPIPRLIGTGIGCFLLFLFLSWALSSEIGFMVAFVVFIILNLVLLPTSLALKSKAENWDKQKAALENLWVCLQCGSEWRPNRPF